MDVERLIKEMTLEEKASLLSGADFWHTKAVERLGIPATMVSDGPHGLRKQDDKADHLGVNESIKAVCFPAASASAASFDRSLLRQIGEAVGDACQHEGLSVILGPAVNIKRSPLCGRNFEYFSEDPYLTGELATAQIEGVQSRNVGTSIKHFAANNQEHRRMSSDSVVDERTLREIYFPAFETAVKRAQPWTVMCSYNRLNGEYASQNKWLLTDLLKKEWGFAGYVMSDWGAVSDRVKGVAAGMDLEMPGSGGANDARIVASVKSGVLDEAAVDESVRRILKIVDRFASNAKPETPWDMEAQHKLARRLAAECMVLLKNDAGVLPLKADEKVAIIGKFAAAPRYQGGGSSHINSFRVESLVDALAGNANVTYEEGYDIVSEEPDEALIAKAVAAAAAADKAVIVAGLPDSFESEGYDRTHMRMPKCQNELISRVAAANPNTVVVLYNGSPVEMPWADDVRGIVEAYLGGQAVGGATKDVLWGDVNPSGRLPETFPMKLEDNPSYLSYGGEGNTAVYSEGIFVGYRYYDKKQMPVRFPFGYGLSYTTFAYDGLKLDAKRAAGADGNAAAAQLAGADGNAAAAQSAGADGNAVAALRIADTDTLLVSVKVTNTGSCAGKEVVQLYVAAPEGDVFRPIRELKGIEKVELAPGETKTVTFELAKRAFAYWDKNLHDWFVADGNYAIEIGRSSRDIVLAETVAVVGTVKPYAEPLTPDTIYMDLAAHPGAFEKFGGMLKEAMGVIGGDSEGQEASSEAITEEMNDAMLRYMPLRGAVNFGGGAVSYDDLVKQLSEFKED